MGYQERDPQQRKRFLRLRERFIRRGKRPVHIDEYGFASSTARRYGYAPKGQRVDGLVSGHRRPRTSLIAARMEGRLEEPLLFEGTCDTVVFNTWLQTRLCPRLNAQHLVILDNATFPNRQRQHSSSPPPAPRCSSCRRTHPTSTRLSMTSPLSKNAGNTTKPLHSRKLSKPINKYRLSYKYFFR